MVGLIHLAGREAALPKALAVRTRLARRSVSGRSYSLRALLRHKLPSHLCLLVRIQPVDATVWLNISAGVRKLRVFLGLSFNLRANALSWACE